MHRILLADDHLVVRQGLRALLERSGFSVVAEASDGAEAVRLADAHRPDLVILDVFMPRLTGLQSAAEIIAANPKANVLLLTIHEAEWDIIAALRAGIRGYLVKTEPADELIRAVRQVAGGGTYLSARISKFVVGAYLTGESAGDQLTDREQQLLRLIAFGKTSREVAAEMAVTVKTAESYRVRLMTKLDVHDTAALVRYAVRRGLITP